MCLRYWEYTSGRLSTGCALVGRVGCGSAPVASRIATVPSKSPISEVQIGGAGVPGTRKRSSPRGFVAESHGSSSSFTPPMEGAPCPAYAPLAALWAYLRAKGLHMGANIHDADGVGPHEAQFRPMAMAMGLAPRSAKPIPLDLLNATYVRALEDVVLRAVERDGMDFWWIDWQQGRAGLPGGKLNPTIVTNHVRATDKLRRRQNERGLVLARWGGMGNHRYQVRPCAPAPTLAVHSCAESLYAATHILQCSRMQRSSGHGVPYSLPLPPSDGPGHDVGGRHNHGPGARAAQAHPGGPGRPSHLLPRNPQPPAAAGEATTANRM